MPRSLCALGAASGTSARSDTVAEAAIEALDVAVLHGLSLLDQNVSNAVTPAQPMKARLVNFGPLSVLTAAG